MFGLQYGNSKFHSVFGLSCDFSRLDRPFNSCLACARQVDEYISSRTWDRPIYHNVTTPCLSCYGWSLEIVTCIGEYAGRETNTVYSCLNQIEGSYPGKNLINHPGYLSPGMLKSAWEFCFHRFNIQRDLNEKQVRWYLQMHCFNNEVIENFIDCSRNCMILEDCQTRPEMIDDDLLVDRMLLDFSENPGNYKPPQIPPFLELVDSFSVCTETPMHQLMGVTKAIFTLVLEWAAGLSRQSNLIADINARLESIRCMSLDQFPAISVSGDKFGGYVAENYRCLCMLSPWIFECLTSPKYQPRPLDSDPPVDKPISRWTLRECHAWMANRSLSMARNVPVKEARLTVEMHKTENPRFDSGWVPTRPSGVGAYDVRGLIWSLFQVCRCLMGADESWERGRNRSLAYVMKLLSALEDIDRVSRPESKTQMWLAKFNFVSLLRTCEHFRKYGLVRHLHEGGPEGEGMVKQLRPMFAKSSRSGWSGRFLARYSREKVLEYMTDFASRQINGDVDEPLLQSKTAEDALPDYRFRRYRSCEEIRFLLEIGKPISVLTFGLGDVWIFGAVIVVGLSRYLVSFYLPDTASTIDEQGFCYFPITIDEETGILEIANKFTGRLMVPTANGLRFIKHVLLLPSSAINSDDLNVHQMHSYALLDDNMQFAIGRNLWSTP